MDTLKLQTIYNDKGLALIYVALALFALIAILGLVIDLGHMYVVRGELQNAADASALAGADKLYNTSSPPAVDFTAALGSATNFIGENKSDGKALSSGTVETGSWDNSAKVFTATLVPPAPPLAPAVRVTINRASGTNGGAVPTYFAKIFGADNVAVASHPAVASRGYPGSVPENILFPIALSSCMTDQYFSQDPLPSPPTTIVFDSVYAPGGSGCYTGQWTSFKLDNNDVPTIRDLIDNGNPTSLNTGDNIWIEPGAKASLYGYVNSWLPSGGKDVLMPIVDGTTGITTHAEMPIKGFATFHIVSADQSGKTVTGYFISYSTNYPGTSPGGSVSNTITPPVMVQ